MSSEPPNPVEPTLADVAALIRARTKDDTGHELGEFTDKTRPTAEQVQEAIDHAVITLGEKVGTVGPACADVARMCAAYGAAAEIELSYLPEQIRTDRSPYQFLLKRWEEALEGTRQCVLGNRPGETEEGETVSGLGWGTVGVTSAVVHDYYTGQLGAFGGGLGEEEGPPEGQP